MNHLSGTGKCLHWDVAGQSGRLRDNNNSMIKRLEHLSSPNYYVVRFIEAALLKGYTKVEIRIQNKNCPAGPIKFDFQYLWHQCGHSSESSSFIISQETILAWAVIAANSVAHLLVDCKLRLRVIATLREVITPCWVTFVLRPQEGCDSLWNTS